MKVKDKSVKIDGLQIEMQPVLRHASAIWKEILGVEAVITSGCEAVNGDGKLIHSPGSLHYYGYAVDLRTWDSNARQLTQEKKFIIAEYLRNALRPYSDYYQVIIEKDHLHVEFDIFIKRREEIGSAKIF